MAHEVEAMLYSNETPWHRIGQRITEDQANDVDWIKNASLDRVDSGEASPVSRGRA
jgi:hypothetical protein